MFLGIMHYRESQNFQLMRVRLSYMLSERKYYGHLNTNSKILDRSEWWDGEKKSEEREIDTPHEKG